MNFRLILLFLGISPSLDLLFLFQSKKFVTEPRNHAGVAYDSLLDGWFIDLLVVISLFSSGLSLPALIVITAS